MKKKLLAIVFPVFLIVACSLAVWANEQVPTHPGCNNCAKAGKIMQIEIDARDADAAKGCDNCAKLKDGGGTAVDGRGCGNCPNAIRAEEQPCCGKAQQNETRPLRNRANEN